MTVNGVSVNAPAFQSAMQACRSKLPNGGHPPPLSAARKQAMLKFSQCMRAHGLANFPDPTFGSNGRLGLLFHASSGLDPNSQAFKQAQAACAQYLIATRWPDGFVCPGCGGGKAWRLQTKA